MSSLPFVRQCACALFLLAGLAAMHASAQTLAPQPNLDLLIDGQVRAMLREPDGSLIVGGAFSRIDGHVRRNVARIRPDGSIDPVWAPQVGTARHGDVTALARDPSGAIYIAGSFGEVNGDVRYGMAKVSANGAGLLDPAWNASVNGAASAVGVDAAGRVYIGGVFNAVGGVPRAYLARLSGSTGALDPDWTPTADGTVDALLLGADGASVYIGGWFGQVNGQARGHVAKLATAAGAALDATWHPVADNAVFALAQDSADSIFIAGQFTTLGGNARRSLARVSTTGAGAVDMTWAPAVWGSIQTLAVTPDTVYAGGLLGNENDTTHRYLARIARAGSGTIDAQWRPAPDGPVYVLDVDATGGVHAGGRFRRVGALPAVALARIRPNGSLAAALDVMLPGQVMALATQADGGVIVGGQFQRAAGQPRANLLRILPDGSLDPAWIADADAAVRALAVSPAGAIYAGGEFYSIGGETRPSLARLRADGSVDDGWGPVAFNGSIHALSRDREWLYAAGYFSQVAGDNFAGVVRLAAGDGIADTSWRPQPDTAYAIATVVADGADVYIGGYFSSVGGTASKGFAKLSAVDASADPAFDLQLDGSVEAIAPSARGLVVAGYFSQARGQARLGIARLHANGSIDTDYTASAELGTVNALAIDAAGNLYAAGSFYRAGGESRENLARFLPDGAIDLAWIPQPDNTLETVAIHRERIFTGGAFGTIAAEKRAGFAGFVDDDLTYWLQPIHVDSFE